MKTQITVRKADGSVKIVEREGHIVDAAARAKIEASAVKLGAEVIGWQLVSPAPKVAPIVSGRARQRFNRYQQQRIQAPRFNADNTERCRGCGRIGDDGECGLGHY